MAFTHLQVKSGYSLFQSTLKIESIVKKAQTLNFKAIALTDEKVLHGVIPFYQACMNANIKPIIGMGIEVKIDKSKERCLLLAQTNSGYDHLKEISTIIQYDPNLLIEIEDLQRLSDGLICIIPTDRGSIREHLLHGTHEETKHEVNKWLNVFAKSQLYLGIQNNGDNLEHPLYTALKDFCKQFDIQVVALHDVRYLEKEDVLSYSCLQSLQDRSPWSGKVKEVEKGKYMRTTEEMKQFFADWPEVIHATEQIARSCHVTIDLDQYLMPSFPVANGVEADVYLKSLCIKNAKQKYGDKLPVDVEQRLEHELQIIGSMGFSDYFLIVADVVHFAKEKGILVGPGRGSAAGSLVAYVLGITEVDPLKYGLLFERFLNPERVSMPDIDIDFSDRRRDEVIQYMFDTYGKEHVSQIITFGTYGARSILRDLFHVMEIDQKDVQFILSHFPKGANITIRQVYRQSTSLRQYVDQSPKLKRLFNIANKLEGLPRNISTHAAGIVLSDQPLKQHTPLMKGSSDRPLTQYAMDDLEAIGLLKIDLLGLRNLTLLETILKTIYTRHKRKVSLNDLPLNDEKTFQLLQKGLTNGIFQLESDGMKRVLQKLKPTTFEDIVAVNALYRPGPSEFIDTYIQRKHGQARVQYLHEDLKPILSQTNGVLIYQEQILRIAHHFAKMTIGEADVLRRAISQKNKTLIVEQKQVFIQGCVNNGYEQHVAEALFNWIVKFSNYGFNRSHSVAYSKISYQLAYLKAHYPTEFFASCFNAMINRREKLYPYKKEAQSLGIKILAPSINKSSYQYTIENNNIRMGLLAIKGIGYDVATEIIRARQDGAFKSLFDFCLRVSLKTIHQSVIEKLIMAGTFDDLYDNRAALVASIDQAIEQGELFGDLTEQTSILTETFGFREQYAQVKDFNVLEKLQNEKELLGWYVSNHPIESYRNQVNVPQILTIESLRKNRAAKQITCMGMIQSVRTIRTRNGLPMAFIELSDETGDIEAVAFPEQYRQEKELIQEGQLVIVQGNRDEHRQKTQLIIHRMIPLETAMTQKKHEAKLFIRIESANSHQALNYLKKMAHHYPGEVVPIIYQRDVKKTYQLSNAYRLLANEQTIKVLEQYFGAENIHFEK